MLSNMNPELDPLGIDLRKRMIYRATKEYTGLGHVSNVVLHQLLRCTCRATTSVLVVGDKDLVSLEDVIVKSY
jgi:hypothetical protein